LFHDLLKDQQEFFHSGQSRKLDFRINALNQLKDAIHKHEADILEALFADLNKTEFDAYATEIGIIYDEIKYASKNIHKWARPEKVPSPIILWPSSSFVLKEPFGVTLIISPWNYPFQLLLAPLVGAIGAGNTAILKPSEISENTAKVIEEIINNTFPKEYIHVVQGAAEETRELINLPFDYIFFTGSIKVGKIVAEAAARNLVPVTLELGGKSPVIVHKDARLKGAARKIAWGKYLNSGQTCIAPDYVLVHQSIKDAFLEQLFKVIQEFYGEDTSTHPSCCRIVNDRNYQRLVSLIDGKKVAYGGKTISAERYISPTVLYPVDWDDPVMADEIFGPLLPVIVYSEMDEVIQKINARSSPLALYLFSDDPSVQLRVTGEIRYGGGAINNTLLQVSSHFLPFGGIGSSGTGAYHGKTSFDTFSHRKSIVKSSSTIDPGLAYPDKQLGIKRLKQLVPNFRP